MSRGPDIPPAESCVRRRTDRTAREAHAADIPERETAARATQDRTPDEAARLA